jgi:hypothetical protein
MLIIIMILMTKSSSKTGIRPTFMGKFAKFCIVCSLSAGSDTMGPMTIRWSGGHPCHRTSPYDFFLWSYVKDTVYMPPFSRTLQELQNRTVAALGGVTTDMLQRVWQEIDYRLDVCRGTRIARIEGL